MNEPDAVSVCLCPKQLQSQALQLLNQEFAPIATDASILQDIHDDPIDLSGLWVALQNERVVGALLTQTLAGQIGAVWPPKVINGLSTHKIAENLLAAGLRHLKRLGCRLAQALIDKDSDPAAARDLTRAGLMFRSTAVAFLRRETVTPIETDTSARKIRWSTLNKANEPLFNDVLNASYLDSLDMPELKDLRTFDDMVAGQKATGRFNPAHWFLGTLEGQIQPSLILIMTDSHEDTSTISYLGIAPSARRQGLGLLAIEFARAQAESTANWLEVTVDQRNTPAVSLYKKAGFETWLERDLYLAYL